MQIYGIDLAKEKFDVSFFDLTSKKVSNQPSHKVVKNNFKRNQEPCTCPKDFPVCVCGQVSKGKVITRKPILPSDEELEENSRSRSAKLRVFERKIV